jgi:hypothetical protein
LGSKIMRGGRIREQTQARSSLYTPEKLEAKDDDSTSLWQAALRSLTSVRRVVIPFGGRKDFSLSNDKLEAGSKLWANLLGLMCANAFLEQRNRKIKEHAGQKAIYASAEDYRVAYELLEGIARRSVEGLGESHKKILKAIYELRQESDFGEGGFSYKQIADKAKISKGTVSKNRSYLVRSLGMLYEVEQTGKLNIPSDATPEWWEGGEAMVGFPHPDVVASWEGHIPSPTPGNDGNAETVSPNRDSFAEKPVSPNGNHSGNVSNPKGPKVCRHPKRERVMGNNGEEVCGRCGKYVGPEDKVAAQKKAYEAFLTFGERIDNGGVLRSLWRAKALDMGMTGREFGTAARQLEAAGRVEPREYADQKDRYYYRPRELGGE